MSMIKTFIFCVAIQTTLTTQLFDSICKSFKTADELKVPALPLNFTAVIEAKFLDKDERFIITEYYDYYANRMAMEWKDKKQIIDFIRMEYRLINVKNNVNKCLRVIKLPNQKPRFSFGSDHLAGTSDIFHFGKQFGEKFINKTEVRNIKCNQWQSCMSTNYSNIVIDYYFTDDINPLPVRCEVKGIMESPITGTNRTIHHIYDFFIFKTGPPPSVMFQAPKGTYCNNVAKQLPIPSLSDHITYAVEYHSLDVNKQFMIRHGKIYFDFIDKTYRSDHYYFSGGKRQPITVIQDEHFGLQFLITSPYSCIVKELDKSLYEKEYVENHLNLKKAMEDLRAHNHKFSYEGTSIVRGIEANVWIYKRNVTDQAHFNRLEWYFWSQNQVNVTKTGIPMKIIGYYGNNTNILFTVDLLHYDDMQHSRESILNPVRPCFQTMSSLYEITFFMIGLSSRELKAMNDQQLLIRNIMQTFKGIAGLKSSSRFSVELVMSTKSIDVRLSILGWPLSSIKKPSDFIETSFIVKIITKAVDRGGVNVKFNLSSGKEITAYFSKKYIDKISTAKTCHKTETIYILISTLGFVAGMIIMMVLLNFGLRKNGLSLRQLLRSYTKFSNTEKTTQVNDATNTGDTEMS